MSVSRHITHTQTGLNKKDSDQENRKPIVRRVRPTENEYAAMDCQYFEKTRKHVRRKIIPTRTRRTCSMAGSEQLLAKSCRGKEALPVISFRNLRCEYSHVFRYDDEGNCPDESRAMYQTSEDTISLAMFQLLKRMRECSCVVNTEVEDHKYS